MKPERADPVDGPGPAAAATPAVPADEGRPHPTFLSAERTLMSWMRTSLSMISFGFTMVKALEVLEQQTFKGLMGRQWTPRTFGLTLTAIGTVSLVLAVVEHQFWLRRLHAAGLAPRFSLTLAAAAVLALLGLFAFGGILLGR